MNGQRLLNELKLSTFKVSLSVFWKSFTLVIIGIIAMAIKNKLVKVVNVHDNSFVKVAECIC